MHKEFSEILADVKEQILYLQELGVENLSVDLAEIPGFKMPPVESKTPVIKTETEIPQERLEKFVPDFAELKSIVKKPEAETNETKTSRGNLLEATKLSRLASMP